MGVGGGTNKWSSKLLFFEQTKVTPVCKKKTVSEKGTSRYLVLAADNILVHKNTIKHLSFGVWHCCPLKT